MQQPEQEVVPVLRTTPPARELSIAVLEDLGTAADPACEASEVGGAVAVLKDGGVEPEPPCETTELSGAGAMLADISMVPETPCETTMLSGAGALLEDLGVVPDHGCEVSIFNGDVYNEFDCQAGGEGTARSLPTPRATEAIEVPTYEPTNTSSGRQLQV